MGKNVGYLWRFCLNETRNWCCHHSRQTLHLWHAHMLFNLSTGGNRVFFFQTKFSAYTGYSWCHSLLMCGLKYPMLVSVVRCQHRGPSSFHFFLWRAKCYSQFRCRDKKATKNNSWMLAMGAMKTCLILCSGWIVKEHLLVFGWDFGPGAMAALGTCPPFKPVPDWKKLCGQNLFLTFFLLLNCFYSFSFVRFCQCTNVIKISQT